MPAARLLADAAGVQAGADGQGHGGEAEGAAVPQERDDGADADDE